MTGLEEGVNYEFRVRGVNDAGVGMDSMPSDPMTAKALAGIVSSKICFRRFPSHHVVEYSSLESGEVSFSHSVRSRVPGDVLHSRQEDR